MMIAWPDLWYHTSGDLVDKADPTQLRRAVIIGAAAAYTIAAAGDETAVNLAGEIAGNAVRRLGHQLNVAMDMINSSTAENLHENYKKAVWLLEAHLENEEATILSVGELASSHDVVSGHLDNLVELTGNSGRSYIAALESQMKMRAAAVGATPAEILLSETERRAAGMVPVLAEGMLKGGQGLLAGLLAGLPQETLAAYPVRTRIDRTEIARLVNGKNPVLMIKKMIDAQNRTETDLDDIINFIYQLQEAGVVVIESVATI